MEEIRINLVDFIKLLFAKNDERKLAILTRIKFPKIGDKEVRTRGHQPPMVALRRLLRDEWSLNDFSLCGQKFFEEANKEEKKSRARWLTSQGNAISRLKDQLNLFQPFKYLCASPPGLNFRQGPAVITSSPHVVMTKEGEDHEYLMRIGTSKSPLAEDRAIAICHVMHLATGGSLPITHCLYVCIARGKFIAAEAVSLELLGRITECMTFIIANWPKIVPPVAPVPDESSTVGATPK